MNIKTNKPMYNVIVDFTNYANGVYVPPSRRVEKLREVKRDLDKNYPLYDWLVTDENVTLEGPLSAPSVELEALMAQLQAPDPLYNHQQLMLDNMRASGNTIIETSRQTGSTHTVIEYIKGLVETRREFLIRYISPNARNTSDVSKTVCTEFGIRGGANKHEILYNGNIIRFHSTIPHCSEIRGYSHDGIVDIYDNTPMSTGWVQGMLECRSVSALAASRGSFGHKTVMVRTGQPNTLYRKAILTGNLDGLSFPNRLKMDHTEIALLNEDQENSPLILKDQFDLRKYEKLHDQIGSAAFAREYRLNLDLTGESEPPYVY